jgi:hypothetical protein
MAEWHLKELRAALERRGWRFLTEHAGDAYRISATWEFVRDGKSILIDFDGLTISDDMDTLPIEQSYGCCLRGKPLVSLYFSKRGEKGSSARSAWVAAVKDFSDLIDRSVCCV